MPRIVRIFQRNESQSQTEHDLSQLSVVTAFLWRGIITLLLVQLPVHCGEIYLFFNQWYTNMLNSLFSRVYIFFQSPALFSQNYCCNGIFDYLKPENIPKTGSWGWPRLKLRVYCGLDKPTENWNNNNVTLIISCQKIAVATTHGSQKFERFLEDKLKH